MRSQEVKDFIRKNSYLFWYTPEDKKEDISDEFLMETILNYGTLDDFITFKNILGVSYLSNLFFNLERRKKLNYFPEIYNFFSLYFQHYAQRDTK